MTDIFWAPCRGFAAFSGSRRRATLPGLSLLAVCAALSLNQSPAAPAPASSPRTYTNPVYAGSMPDPSVIRTHGVYYAFGTTGAGRMADGNVFKVLRSTNLVNWEELGGALIPPSPNRRVQYWAPEVTESQGVFYLYYAMGGIEPERFELRVAASKRPEGPYADQGQPLIDCESNRFTIDPFPFRDDDGSWYMFYARNFTNTPPGTFAGTALAVDRLLGMTRLAGNCQVVVRAKYDWTLYEANRQMEVYDRTFDWHTIEGPCVLKHEGKIYCFYSGSNWQSANYGVDYVVAGRPLGPYTGQADRPRVLHSVTGKVRGPGHHSTVRSPDGTAEYLVYHAWDKAMKARQMCIDKLEWTADGPRCLGPTVTPQPAP